MFLRDQDAPAMMPWNLVVKYDPDQPRDDDGKWTDGGGGGPVEASVANAHRKIARRVKTYEQYGGETEVLSAQDAVSAPSELDALEEALREESTLNPEWPSTKRPLEDAIENGFVFARDAIRQAGEPFMTVYLGRDTPSGGLITGAMSVHKDETLNEWTIGSAGSTGILPSAGSAIFADIVRDAAQAGASILLTSSDFAMDFWESVGMEISGLPEFQEFYAPSERVRAIAGGI